MQPGFIFISGGISNPFNEDTDIAANDVERYNSVKNIWETLPAMNLPRIGNSSCTLGNTLYVIGGSRNMT